jgi:hypothetical protein
MRRAAVNLMELELNAYCTVWKTWNINGHPLICVFFGNNFLCPSVFPVSHCAFTTAVYQKVKVCIGPNMVSATNI